MTLEVENYRLTNIILVETFTPLDFFLISRRQFVDRLSDRFPHIQSVPEAILLINAKTRTSAFISDSKLEYNQAIENARHGEDIEEWFLRIHESLNPRTTAFGVNYDSSFKLKGLEDSEGFLLKRFLKEPTELSKKVKGRIFKAGLKLFYEKQGYIVDINLEPHSSEKDVVMYRYHLHRDCTELPTAEELGSIIEQNRQASFSLLEVL